MAIARRKPDPDGIEAAELAGTVRRYVSRRPLDVEAAVAELREIADGRGDLLAREAGLALAFCDRDVRAGMWPQRTLEAALLVLAGANLARLTEWVEEGPRRSELMRG
jgi:hypothetical protein